MTGRGATGRLDQDDIGAKLSEEEPRQLATIVRAINHAIRRQHRFPELLSRAAFRGLASGA